ncbi:MAG: DUF1569 domain-containing protein [Saprospiraceae bacterium]
MKANLFNPGTQQSILERIRQFGPDTPRLWGKMTNQEVVCHMADPFRDVLHIRNSKPAFPRLLQPLLRRMVLTEKDWKPNTPTLQVYRQGEGGGGTLPTNFEADKATLLDLIAKFCSMDEQYKFAPHPGIGQLSREQNGFMMWKHTDHHLRQFGV